MLTTDVLIVGAGQAGLALSRSLTDLGVEHLLLERGRIAQRWRDAAPDSLRLLTPNWMSRLPGWRYAGPDPDGFMTKGELVGFLSAYADSFRAPVLEETTVVSARQAPSGFLVETTAGPVGCAALVVATGQCDLPSVPGLASAMDPRIAQLHSSEYRAPASLPDGGVMIVGASSSGVQIAEELARAGRRVVLSVGRHIRLPRTYRGRDAFWWMERAGLLDQRVEDMPDPAAARRQPSMQLVGRPDRRDLDLAVLREAGVEMAGRLAGADGNRLRFTDDLAATTLHADAKLRGLLDRFDAVAGDEPEGPRPDKLVIPTGITDLPLAEGGIRAVVWATGYARRYDWLQVPALTPEGEIDHVGGVARVPGLYALGLRMLRRRNSNFIDGVGADAREIARHIHDHLSAARRRAA